MEDRPIREFGIRSAWTRTLLGLVTTGVAGLALGGSAWAAPAVTNTNDSGPGSLRQAIADASAGDAIDVPAGTYGLISGELKVDKSLTLRGAGARTTILDAGGHSGVIFAQSDLTVSGLTITGGRLDLNGSFTNCPGGGGICQFGNLTVVDSAIVGNVVNATNLTTNAAGGGGIFNNGDVLTVTGSTISGNQVTSNVSEPLRLAHGGGGIFDNGNGPAITNSTIVNNSVTVNGTGSRHGGGGIYLNGSFPTSTMTNTTVAGNTVGGTAPTSGGNVFIDNLPASATFTVKNSIVANGTAPAGANCAGFTAGGGNKDAPASAGGNVESADTCSFNQASDRKNVDPLLAALADNGGQTDTAALQAGSPAIDSAIECPPPATDQRGVARPQFNACDSGAFELAPAPPPPPQPTQRILPKASCLSIPNVTRDRIGPLKGGGKVILRTRQADDTLNPLRLAVKLRGKGAIASVTYTVNGKPVAASGLTAKVPVGTLRIGSRRNRVKAKVTLRDGRKVTLTQLLVVLRCHVPKLACKRLAGNKRLRCRTRTPLAVRRVRVTATGPGNETARGSATVKRGRYTVTLRSSVALPPGIYVYKHVGTTKRRGERFFMVRLFTAA